MPGIELPPPSPAPTTPAIRAEGLVRTFGAHRAVDGIDLRINPGEIYGLLGPNGAGKTTAIRMLATLLPISAGRAEIFGVDVARDAHRVRQLIGVTGQYAAVDEDLTARENLRLFARLQHMSLPQSRRVSEELLSEFSLTDAADKRLAAFSGGMRRRLDLAVSLLSRPPLIFLDEPTTGLDPRTRNQMWETIRSLVAAGTTVLLTTQYLDEADQLADRIGVIDQGRLVAEGTPEELKSSIGGSSLHLRLANRAQTGDARARIDALMGADAVRSHEPGALTVSLQHADDTASVLVALREAGIGIDTMTVRQPTLDEVFLALTGPPGAGAHPTTDARHLQGARQ